jgi:hypothetical protein
LMTDSCCEYTGATIHCWTIENATPNHIRRQYFLKVLKGIKY